MTMTAVWLIGTIQIAGAPIAVRNLIDPLGAIRPSDKRAARASRLNSTGQVVKHGDNMQRASSKDREQFVSLIAQHAGEHNGLNVFQFAQTLMRYGATLGRIAENQCNGYQTPSYEWDEKAEKRDEKKEERIQKRVTDLCAAFQCKPIFQGDPRGNVLKIAVPDGYTNDWGREGICVPTS